MATFEDAGGKLTYAYDDVNQLTKLTEPDGAFSAFQYNAQGSRTKTTYPGGVTIDQTYDAGQRLTSISNKAPNGSVIRSFAYTYGEPATGKDYDLRTRVLENGGDATTYAYDPTTASPALRPRTAPARSPRSSSGPTTPTPTARVRPSTRAPPRPTTTTRPTR